MAKTLTTKDVLVRLKQRCGQEFAVLTEVANGTGAKQTRWADAIGMSLWPSRGLELHGYEIKVSRGDWLKELKAPAKADAIAKYCDRWWVVAGASGIVVPDEMPKPWGLMEPHGEVLRVVKQAEQLTTVPVDRGFLAAIFRRAAQQSVDAETLGAATKAGHVAGYKAGIAEGKRLATSDRRDDEALRTAVEEFERASGVKIEAYAGQHYGQQFRAFLLGDHRILPHSVEKLERIVKELSFSLEKLKDSPLLVADGDAPCQTN